MRGVGWNKLEIERDGGDNTGFVIYEKILIESNI